MTDNFPSHLFFNFCLSKPHTNSLMSSLNSRSGWKYNDTTLSFEHNQVVCYLFIHSQLDSLHVCVWGVQLEQSVQTYFCLYDVCVCVRKKGGVGLFFFLPIFTYFCKVMIVMMMMIKDDGWQISFFLLILDLFFDFLTDFF